MKQKTNTIDQISLNRISKLHPKLRDEAIQIVKEINAALQGRAKFRITSGYRSFSEQFNLYETGRSTPGKIITNARAGFSYHNYGLAIDGTLLIDGTIISWAFQKDWDNDRRADWKEVVDIFKKYGWEWGGDWKKFKDPPHFQKTFGRTVNQLLRLHLLRGNNEYVQI